MGSTCYRCPTPRVARALLVRSLVNELRERRLLLDGDVVQRPRGKQPLTERLGRLYRGELHAHKNLVWVVDAAKDPMPGGGFLAPRRIRVEHPLPHLVVLSVENAQDERHQYLPLVVAAPNLP